MSKFHSDNSAEGFPSDVLRILKLALDPFVTMKARQPVLHALVADGSTDTIRRALGHTFDGGVSVSNSIEQMSYSTSSGVTALQLAMFPTRRQKIVSLLQEEFKRQKVWLPDKDLESRKNEAIKETKALNGVIADCQKALSSNKDAHYRLAIKLDSLPVTAPETERGELQRQLQHAERELSELAARLANHSAQLESFESQMRSVFPKAYADFQRILYDEMYSFNPSGTEQACVVEKLPKLPPPPPNGLPAVRHPKHITDNWANFYSLATEVHTRTLAILNGMCSDVNDERGDGKVTLVDGPLKGEERARAKVLGNYNGDLSRLTDLVRKMILCADYPAMALVLEKIGGSEKVSVALHKNSLGTANLLSLSGLMQRRLLLKLRDIETGMIFEVRFHLTRHHEVSNGDGGLIWSQLRNAGLDLKYDERWTGTLFDESDGQDTDCRGSSGIRSGTIQRCTLQGKRQSSAPISGMPAAETDQSALQGAPLSRYAELLSAPLCVLCDLELEHIQWPNGSTVADLLTDAVFRQLSPYLRNLVVRGFETSGDALAVGARTHDLGSIPDGVFSCTALEVLIFTDIRVSGPLSSNVASLNRLCQLDLGGTAMCGGLPPQIGHLPRLKQVGLYGKHGSILRRECGTWSNLQTHTHYETFEAAVGDIPE